MIEWRNPLLFKLFPTGLRDDVVPDGHTQLPLPPHPGAFGVVRRFHTHEGVDLYAPVGTTAYVVEDGTVVAVEHFTGPESDPPTPHWLPTKAVLVEGASGVVLYGEIWPLRLVGERVSAGEPIGTVVRVLKNYKGYQTSMLHLELHVHGTRRSSEWHDERPEGLLDPTPFLQNIDRPFVSTFSSSGEAVQRIHDLVREGRITPADGATLLELREELRLRRRPWYVRATHFVWRVLTA